MVKPEKTRRQLGSDVGVLKPHLVLKRFARSDPELRPGARRTHDQFPFDVKAEKAATGRSVCHVCRESVAKGELRMRMMLQCHKGYKNACFVHAECFMKHPQSRKVQLREIVFGKGLTKADRQSVMALFEGKTTKKESAPAPAPAPSLARASPRRKSGKTKVESNGAEVKSEPISSSKKKTNTKKASPASSRKKKKKR